MAKLRHMSQLRQSYGVTATRRVASGDMPSPPPSGADDLITVREAAELLRKSTRTVQRLIDAGAIPARQLGTGVTAPWTIRRGDLDALLQAAS